MELTKVKLLREVNNAMCHNWYFGCYARLLNAEATKVRRFSFVLWFDAEDVCEYYDKDSFNNKMVRDYAREIAWSFIPNDLVFDDDARCRSFGAECRKTIEEYNNN